MYNREEFDREYFEQGPMTGKSLYTNYRWLPELTLPLCHHLVTYCGMMQEDRILDFGCAKGYVVHGLRLLGYDAHGIDVSEYAISQAPREVNGYVTKIEPFEEISIDFDWVICKDILEHLPYESIDEQLQLLADCTKNLIAMVPLGDGHKYYIEAYEQDITHIIREDLKWWEDRFFRNGFNVDQMTYDMGPFKTNWQIHPQGNGLFCCSTL